MVHKDFIFVVIDIINHKDSHKKGSFKLIHLLRNETAAIFTLNPITIDSKLRFDVFL